MIGGIAVASRRLASLLSVWSVRCSYNGPVSPLSRLSQESELSFRFYCFQYYRVHLIVFEVHYTILCICVAQRIYVNFLLLKNILPVIRLNPIKITRYINKVRKCYCLEILRIFRLTFDTFLLHFLGELRFAYTVSFTHLRLNNKIAFSDREKTFRSQEKGNMPWYRKARRK
ncbi:hypothetical protein ALC57_08587 [Trachymyrmex cornetzi]|uniref:Uncharacterized protein n=1 Tax=Trachymyrmex cornetzi TaxID=471704 RepID=A0A151J6T9_9HYME|nr:hypothetical protein ALC57_08587 [Trachymyrmex cornetzi]